MLTRSPGSPWVIPVCSQGFCLPTSCFCPLISLPGSTQVFFYFVVWCFYSVIWELTVQKDDKKHKEHGPEDVTIHSRHLKAAIINICIKVQYIPAALRGFTASFSSLSRCPTLSFTVLAHSHSLSEWHSNPQQEVVFRYLWKKSRAAQQYAHEKYNHIVIILTDASVGIRCMISCGGIPNDPDDVTSSLTSGEQYLWERTSAAPQHFIRTHVTVIKEMQLLAIFGILRLIATLWLR